MRRKALICALYALSLVTAGWLLAPHGVQADPGKGKGNDNGPETVKIELTADDEVPIAISDASGELVLTIDAAGTSIGYQLTYTALEGNVTQAHIHIGQKNVAGGIVLWLCQTVAPFVAPATVPAAPTCPASGTVSGTLTAANVVPNVQAVRTDSLADVIDAIHRGKAYGNVHSSVSAGGEIRGQLHH